MKKDKKLFKTKIVSIICGITQTGIRHYEQSGIVQGSKNSSGYREYTYRELFRLLIAVNYSNLGLQLNKIQQILSSKDPNIQINYLEENLKNLNAEEFFIKHKILLNEYYLNLKKHYLNALENTVILTDLDIYYIKFDPQDKNFRKPNFQKILKKWIDIKPIAFPINLWPDLIEENQHPIYGYGMIPDSYKAFDMPITNTMHFNPCQALALVINIKDGMSSYEIYKKISKQVEKKGFIPYNNAIGFWINTYEKNGEFYETYLVFIEIGS